MGKKWGIWLIAAVLGLSSSALAGNRAVMVDANGVLRNPSANIFAESNELLRRKDIPFLFSSNCNWRIVPTVSDFRFAFGSNIVMRLAYGECDSPNVISLSVDTNPPSMTLVFESAGTSNRLETTTNTLSWATWNDCTWSYTNGTGTVVATEVDLDTPTWARIVSLSGIVATNPYLHVMAPIYSGAETSAATRVATMAELSAVQYSKASKTEVSFYTPLIHQLMTMGAPSILTNMETGIITTNRMTPGDLYPVWSFDKDTGLVYFKDSSISNLTLGGVTRTNWPQGTILGATINPPHTVATNDGLLAFTIGATGSGFPLTNDVSAAGFGIQGMDEVVANSLYATNDASVRDLTVRRNVQVLGNAEYAGDFTVSGNLTLIGSATNLNWVVIDNRTNVYGGTNYYETTVYATNEVYQKTTVYTNIVTTNNVYTYVNNNGMWNATNSEYVWLPHLYDYRDGNAEAIGTWDFADATVSNLYLPPDAIQTASIAALADGVATIDLGSNWCWRLDASGDITAINFSTAGLKEGAMNANSVKGILLEVSRGSTANWAWGGHLSHITNTAPPADAVSHFVLIGPSQDVTGTNGWAVY